MIIFFIILYLFVGSIASQVFHRNEGWEHPVFMDDYDKYWRFAGWFYGYVWPVTIIVFIVYYIFYVLDKMAWWLVNKF